MISLEQYTKNKIKLLPSVISFTHDCHWNSSQKQKTKQISKLIIDGGGTVRKIILTGASLLKLYTCNMVNPIYSDHDNLGLMKIRYNKIRNSLKQIFWVVATLVHEKF